MTTSRRVFVLLAALVVAGCGNDNKAVDPVWGKEPCAHCRMLVQDRQHAAQAVEAGDRFYFDDIGCLVLWQRGHAPSRAWVRDGVTPGWLDAATARYRDGATTPMDFGFEGRSDGGPLGFGDVRERVLAREAGR